MTERKQLPTLQTERLILCPFSMGDAADVQRLAGDAEIALNTLNMPHPYEDGVAEKWIATHQEKFDSGEIVSFAITLRDGNALVGCISLTIESPHERAEMGYWVGKRCWNNGYCTEAASAVLQYGFEELKLNRVQASHFKGNPASGRVMQKVGMSYEGCLRQYVKRGDGFKDLKYYGILRGEYECRGPA